MRSMKVILKFLPILFLPLLWTYGFGADRVRIGYSSITANRLPFWLAQEAGIFNRHGIDAELLLIPSGTTAVQALVAGEVQLLTATGTTAVAATLRGADLAIVGSLGVNSLRHRAFGPLKTSKAKESVLRASVLLPILAPVACCAFSASIRTRTLCFCRPASPVPLNG